MQKIDAQRFSSSRNRCPTRSKQQKSMPNGRVGHGNLLSTDKGTTETAHRQVHWYAVQVVADPTQQWCTIWFWGGRACSEPTGRWLVRPGAQTSPYEFALSQPQRWSMGRFWIGWRFALGQPSSGARSGSGVDRHLLQEQRHGTASPSHVPARCLPTSPLQPSPLPPSGTYSRIFGRNLANNHAQRSTGLKEGWLECICEWRSTGLKRGMAGMYL